MTTYIDTIHHYQPVNEQECNDQRLILDMIQAHPDTILTRSNEIAHITSSAFILNPFRTQTLMIHHNIMNTWAWTGGHADGNPDLYQVAVREALEETGVATLRPISAQLASLDILPVSGHWKNGRYVSTHLHLSAAYLLLCEEDARLTSKPDENSGVGWIPVTHINSSYFSDADVYLYQKLLHRASQIPLEI